MKSLFFLFVTLTSTSAFLLDFLKQEKWDGLKVTWGPNPISSSYFVGMPRTVSDAVKQGFQKIGDCDSSAKWRGQRYIKDGDYALILLFDVNGYIAGMQTSVPKNQPDGYPKSQITPPFVEDGNHYFLTAYFVDPSTICAGGRSANDFNDQGTGTNLYIQNGTMPEKDSIMIPHKQEGMAGTKWTKGKCFYTMGLHYWYDLADDMSCDRFFPVFLLYNNGELTAFGWALGTNLQSPHFEHPGQTTYPLFMQSVPKCLSTQGTLSTMHIYLTSNVALDLC